MTRLSLLPDLACFQNTRSHKSRIGTGSLFVWNNPNGGTSSDC